MKRIAFITDVHLDESLPIKNHINPKKNLEKVVNDLLSKDISDVIFGGDIGASSSHDWFFEILNPFNLQLVIGNHDDFKKIEPHYCPVKEHQELYYCEDGENYKYLYLDTSRDEISQTQLKWLQSQLVTSKKVLLFLHHPIIEIATPVDKLYPLKNRKQLQSILLDHKKELIIFCGHYHMNDESSYKNIKQIITSSLSFQIVKQAPELKIDNSTFGYRIIEVENDTVTTEIVEFKNDTEAL